MERSTEILSNIDILFDLVKRSDLFQPIFGDGGSARLCNLVQFAACVGPTVGQRNPIIDTFEQAIVSCISEA